MGVWRIHPQTTKRSKENREDRDRVHRQQEKAVLQPLGKHSQEGAPGLSQVEVCVFTLFTHFCSLYHKRHCLVWAYLFQQQIKPKEEVLMMFSAHSVIFYILKHVSYL